MVGENVQSRRDFLKLLGEGLAGIAIVGFVAPTINSCSSPTNPGADVAAFNITVDVSSLTANNQGLRTNTPDGHDLLVVRHSPTSYGTLLMVCTHQSCTGSSMVQSGTTIVCTCHDSRFDLSGNVTQGPASANLTTYSTAYDAATKKVMIHN
jgi:cytochrome b6-f complex iron-sulfur subunit